MNTRQRSIRPIIVFGVLSTCALAWVLGVEFGKQTPLSRWQTFQEADAESVKRGLPLVVVFSAAWCEPCKAMERTTFSDKHVKEVLDREYVAIRVDIDDLREGKPLSQRYKVESVPSILVIRRSDNSLRRREGYMESAEFLGWLADSGRTLQKRANLRDGLIRASEQQQPHLVVLVPSDDAIPEMKKMLYEPFYLLDVEKNYVVSYVSAERKDEIRMLDSLGADSRMYTARGGKLLLLSSEGRQLAFHAVSFGMEPRELKEFLTGE